MTNSALITYYIKAPPASDPTLEITDGRGLTRTATLPRNAGIHRYRWDLRFTTTALTDSQKEAITRRFEQLIRAQGEEVATYQQSFDRYRAATNDAERREAIRVLMEMGGGLANDLRGPVASPGSYKLTLTVDGRRYVGTLAVRPDPILDPR
jgi:hypothetical protein